MKFGVGIKVRLTRQVHENQIRMPTGIIKEVDNTALLIHFEPSVTWGWGEDNRYWWVSENIIELVEPQWNEAEAVLPATLQSSFNTWRKTQEG